MGGQPPLHRVGQQVTVYYRRGRAQEAEIEAPALLWLVPGCIFAVGLFFAVSGALLVFVFGLVAWGAGG
jgi:hypothetical protein